MRFERLTLEQGRHALTLGFHPYLTVIAGVGPEEREGLTGELLGALAGTRRGATLDVVDDAGAAFKIRRAETPAADQVIERDTARDVSEQFVVDGRVDLLANIGLTPGQARQRLRLSASDLGHHDEAVISRLAEQDQDQLWSTAERLLVCNVRVDVESQPADEAEESRVEPEVVDRVQSTHAAYLQACCRARSASRFGGAIVVLGSVLACSIAWNLDGRLALAPLAIVAMAGLFIIGRHHEMRMAEMAEWDALVMAGISTFDQLPRIDGQQTDRIRRARLAEALAEQAEQADHWHSLAGDVPVKWALEHKARVLAAASRLSSDEAERYWPQRPAKTDQAEIAERLVVRLTDLRHVGGSGESLPLILDEPLADVDTSVKQWVLEMIGRSAGSPQVVYLTADEDVAAWARMEAIAGHVAIVEPAGSSSLVDLG